MSARTQIKSMSWNPLTPTNVEIAAKHNDMELESCFTNVEPLGAIPPLPDLLPKPARKADAKAGGEQKRPAASPSQERGSWALQHELLQSQIKRGEECLEQVRKELVDSQADLENWAAYERICGKNPLADYMQSIRAKQQIAKFLPAWLKRQREQLQGLHRKMESAARS